MKLYYNDDIAHLETYQRLIQYWSMIFDKKEKISVLDNMNFNISIFPEIIRVSELLAFHEIEPGYTSPDGYTEMNELIRRLELERLSRYDPERCREFEQLVANAGVGCGNGCSNVMNGVISAILKLPKTIFSRKNSQPEVMLTLPNYTVYAAQLSNMNQVIVPRYVQTTRVNGFLPTFDELHACINENTVAIILTYPNNPAQSTFEGSNIDDLRKIVAYCQEHEIFLIVDNIYQDLVFPHGRRFEEVFAIATSTDYIIKVYGCSKDTPFYSGYRTAYWFGDPRISNFYRYYISSTENSLNTYSLSLFALNLYFKSLSINNGAPVLEDMEYFSQGIFGWSEAVQQSQLFEKLARLDLYEIYRQRITYSNALQESTISNVSDYIKQSGQFIDHVNQNIGNVMFIRVDPEYFSGNDDDLFNFLFYQAKVGVLPGNVFGVPFDDPETWFRITLIHDTAEHIIESLAPSSMHFVLGGAESARCARLFFASWSDSRQERGRWASPAQLLPQYVLRYDQTCVDAVNAARETMQHLEPNEVTSSWHARFIEASDYLELYAREHGDAVPLAERIAAIQASFAATQTYQHTTDELLYGAKVAWRNNADCIGKFYWQQLLLRDQRHLRTADEVFAALVEHLRLAANSGKIRLLITVFAPPKPGQPGIRIWNTQLMRYAGYRQADGSVIGDPLNAEFTEAVTRMGWRGAGTPFDTLPLVIQMPGQSPLIYELPQDVIFEVPISHPEYPWFVELGLRWYAFPTISNSRLEIGGVSYTAAPFSAWFTGAEIGARNLSDAHRYNVLPAVARGLGLATRSDRTLWKDRALLELNVAVLHSFREHGVTMLDHHASARHFLLHEQREAAAGRVTPANWRMIVSPMSGSTTPIYERSYPNIVLKPNFFRQEDPW